MSNNTNRLDRVIANQRKTFAANLAALVVFASTVVASVATLL